MTLHFAYGSNMSRALMQARCRDAQPLGIASLAGWRFVINRVGYGSIAPYQGGRVLGVLWRLSVRDLAAINAYESVSTGFYLRHHLAVRLGPRQAAALVYITRQGGEGRPRPSYIDVVVKAARDWELPDRYIQSLARWSPSAWRGTRARDTGEVG
jgi:cation transport regulator ChaC